MASARLNLLAMKCIVIALACLYWSVVYCRVIDDLLAAPKLPPQPHQRGGNVAIIETDWLTPNGDDAVSLGLKQFGVPVICLIMVQWLAIEIDASSRPQLYRTTSLCGLLVSVPALIMLPTIPYPETARLACTALFLYALFSAKEPDKEERKKREKAKQAGYDRYCEMEQEHPVDF